MVDGSFVVQFPHSGHTLRQCLGDSRFSVSHFMWPDCAAMLLSLLNLFLSRVSEAAVPDFLPCSLEFIGSCCHWLSYSPSWWTVLWRLDICSCQSHCSVSPCHSCGKADYYLVCGFMCSHCGYSSNLRHFWIINGKEYLDCSVTKGLEFLGVSRFIWYEFDCVTLMSLLKGVTLFLLAIFVCTKLVVSCNVCSVFLGIQFCDFVFSGFFSCCISSLVFLFECFVWPWYKFGMMMK